MRNLPTLKQVIDILVADGHPGSALAVNRALNRVKELEAANARLMAAYEDLRQKYEPTAETALTGD